MNFFAVKNVIGFLIIITLISGLVVGVRLVQQQTQLKSKAADCTTGPAGTVTATQANCVFQKRSDISTFYRDNGWCTDQSNYPGIVYNWMTINSQADKDQVASCFATVNVGVGTAPVAGQACDASVLCNDKRDGLYCRGFDGGSYTWISEADANNFCSGQQRLTAECEGSTKAWCWDTTSTGKAAWHPGPPEEGRQCDKRISCGRAIWLPDQSKKLYCRSFNNQNDFRWIDENTAVQSCRNNQYQTTQCTPDGKSSPPETTAWCWDIKDGKGLNWHPNPSPTPTTPAGGPTTPTVTSTPTPTGTPIPTGTTAPTSAPTSAPTTAPTTGSRCDYDILDRDGKSVKAGPIYENDRYTFKITMTNTGRAGQSGDWTKSTQWLQALGNTASLWSIASIYQLPKDQVAKDTNVVFNIDATALPLLTWDKNFEDRSTSFSMAETGTGPFGAACSAEVRVSRKPAGLVATKCYVISENPNEVNSVFSCDDPRAKQYTVNPTILNYTFRDQSPGKKFIFVKFFDVNNRPSNTIEKIVTYSPNPAISNVDCAYDSGSGLTTTYNITGIGFGLRNVDSKLRVGNQNATILRWGSAEIIAQIDQRIEGNTPVQVILEDGRSANGFCTVGTTTATLSVKNQCLSRQFDVDNVEVKIFGSVPEPFARQTIKTDKDGNAQGFAPKLEKNRNYSMIVKAPATLAKRVVFRTASGTSVIGPIVLPCGNIAPSPVPDNIINSFDVSALFSQWSLTKDISRPADLNKDGRVNSVDYAFMKLNFNQQDDVFTLPVVVLPTPSPSPSPTPSSSPSPSPSPSPETYLFHLEGGHA